MPKTIQLKYNEAPDRIFETIEGLVKRRALLISIEGDCAAGKSTLAALIKTRYSCNVIHMDDFFLQPHQRTPERFAEAGGNIDHERFNAELATSLKERTKLRYRVFDCQRLALSEWITLEPTSITIVEGVYSRHPKIDLDYDLKIFMAITAKAQSEIVLDRNGKMLHNRFINEWIPMEKAYFNQYQIVESSDLLIENPNSILCRLTSPALMIGDGK